ncbi:MAG: hypothetical protein ACLUEV_02685 [Alistipes sp.]
MRCKVRSASRRPLQRTRQGYLQAAKQVSATTLAHRAVQRKYDEGLLSSLELQTSATQVQQAKSYLLDVKLQYVIQYRLIRYYQGIPLIEQVH